MGGDQDHNQSAYVWSIICLAGLLSRLHTTATSLAEQERPLRLFAVYDRLDGLEPVVWPLFRCRTGEYFPLCKLHMPPLCPLPISVHRTQAAADRAAARLLYECAGTA